MTAAGTTLGERFFFPRPVHAHVPVEAPHWLFLGLAYAAGAATLATAAFALGEYAFPARPRAGRASYPGAARQREEIRQYLSSIGEVFVEDATVRGVTSAFYLPERDVAVTDDADTYHRLRPTDTYVVFCEHEMRGHHLGQRLPFETPEPRRRGQRSGTRAAGPGRSTGGGHSAGYRAAAEASRHREERITAAFQTLGLTRNASETQVKNAYREKVKAVHPDRGGSERAFSRLQEAYTTARQHAE